ncbi:MAG: zinc-binding alcohol dehydrogenase family protein [bacterium]|nr:zinc-binding alcohol dehydrogenase family protein [bacterium]
MKAVGLYQYLPLSEPASLVEVQIEKPEAAGKDLLVKVKAISVNPVDTKIRVRGPKDVREPELKILGWDVAGVVEAAGDECSLFKIGDEVYYSGSITRPGCDSEYHLVDERIVGKKPKSLSFEEAAALPLTTITAWEALFERLNISTQATDNAGKSVLIIGGAGGVGSIATQLAKQVAGLQVIATASREESIAWCKKMGADYCINHYNPFKDELEKLGIQEVDYILCFNSTEMHIQNMADAIKPQGGICTIVETKDNQPVNINLFQGKSVIFAWELMFTKSIYQTPDMQSQHDLLDRVSELLDQKILKTTLTEVVGSINATNLKEAHRKIETGRAVGKLVLSGFDD